MCPLPGHGCQGPHAPWALHHLTLILTSFGASFFTSLSNRSPKPVNTRLASLGSPSSPFTTSSPISHLVPHSCFFLSAFPSRIKGGHELLQGQKRPSTRPTRSPASKERRHDMEPQVTALLAPHVLYHSVHQQLKPARSKIKS